MYDELIREVAAAREHRAQCGTACEAARDALQDARARERRAEADLRNALEAEVGAALCTPPS